MTDLNPDIRATISKIADDLRHQAAMLDIAAVAKIDADRVHHQQPGAGMAVDELKVKCTELYDANPYLQGNPVAAIDMAIDYLAAQGLLKTPEAGGDAERAEAIKDMMHAVIVYADGVATVGDRPHSFLQKHFHTLNRALTSQPDVRGMMECIRDLADELEAVSSIIDGGPGRPCTKSSRLNIAKHATLIEQARSGGKEG